MANKDLNRLKVVLVEQHKTAKWLAERSQRADDRDHEGMGNS